MPSRKKPAVKPVSSVHVLRVELVDSQPAVWRELHVPSSMSLEQLHHVIQAAFGWQDYHLHMFEDKARKRYGPPGEDEFEEDTLDEANFAVADLAPKARNAFGYIYDFGDDWVHRVEVKKVQPPAPGMKYPACTAGAGACPPEDAGGVYGYQEKLQAIADPDNREREELLEWFGGPVDPTAFDLKATNKAVHAVR